LGTGYLPVAPGTWGSLAVAVIFVLTALAGGGALVVNLVLAGVAAVFSIFCLAWGGYAEAIFGGKDPSQVTADEWAGQALAYIALPGLGGRELAISAAVGFVLFRVMDIVKPPPARQIQRLPAGAGILLDDLIAGVYANIAAQLLLRLALHIQ
jgi:phosphatidylglycerophosphatase A